MKTITLSNEVMVSDPCYVVGTWCQHKLTNVLPGEYQSTVVKYDDRYWGNRNSFIIVVHKDYNTEDKLNWRKLPFDIGVDSGQAGIFSMETYRNNEVFVTGSRKENDGEEWYRHISDYTLDTPFWGTYPNGIVSSSGIGDGGYELRVAKHKGKIVGILLDFFMVNLTGKDIETFRKNNMLGDVCGVCGEDNVDSISCNCKM
jgi:hypothetical protein